MPKFSMDRWMAMVLLSLIGSVYQIPVSASAQGNSPSSVQVPQGYRAVSISAPGEAICNQWSSFWTSGGGNVDVIFVAKPGSDVESGVVAELAKVLGVDGGAKLPEPWEDKSSCLAKEHTVTLALNSKDATRVEELKGKGEFRFMLRLEHDRERLHKEEG